MKTIRYALFVAAVLSTQLAHATSQNVISEPGVVELMGAAAVVGLVLWVRNRRK